MSSLHSNFLLIGVYHYKVIHSSSFVNSGRRRRGYRIRSRTLYLGLVAVDLTVPLTPDLGPAVGCKSILPLGRNLKGPPCISVDKAHKGRDGNLRQGRIGGFGVGTTAWRDRRRIPLDRQTENIQGSRKTSDR